MGRRVLSGAAAGLTGLCLAVGAQAATANFDDIDFAPNSYGWFVNQFSDGGLVFTDDAFAIAPAGHSLPFPSQSQFMEIGSSIDEALTISLAGGGAFDLQSFWMGLGAWNDQAMGGHDLVTLTGQKAANCQFDCTDPTITVPVGYQWTIFDLSGFTGLSSLTISQQVYTLDGLPTTDPTLGGATDAGWLAFDNFDYTADPTGGLGRDGGPAAGVSMLAVPEPAAWALMIVGFGLAGSALRRRRALRVL